MEAVTATVQPPPSVGRTWWSNTRRAPSRRETSTNSRSGTSRSIANRTLGPPLGLSAPVAPSVKGPSSRTHAVSRFHSGHVAMSAQWSKKADAGAVEWTEAVVNVVMKNSMRAY